MAEKAPVSPGHFDRFNFCNAAHSWQITINQLELNGQPQITSPLTMSSMAVTTIDVCSPNAINKTQVLVNATAIHPVHGTVNFNHTYNAPTNPVHFINNVVFGIIDRCTPGSNEEVVFFGEVEISDSTSPAVQWVLLQ